DQILVHLAGKHHGLLASSDFDALITAYASMVAILVPEDYVAERFPAELIPFARRIAELGSPRGDEARVMAALQTLRSGGADTEQSTTEYEEVQAWGRQARASLDNPMERLTSLIEVWNEHARLSPAPEVLIALANLHIERRDAVQNMFREGSSLLMAMRGLPSQVARVAPLDVAAVFLQHGDLASAISHITAMGADGDTESQLLRVMNSAREDDGADAIVELSEAYREARPHVAVGLCRLGLRRFPRDARFATCLARVATTAAEHDDATAWYLAAIELEPDLIGLYDEALGHIDEFLEVGIFRGDSQRARTLAARAQRISDARSARFPSAVPVVAPERIALLLGTAEMHAGNTAEARTLLQRSIEGQANTDALEQLGLLEERTGHYEESVTVYRRALDLATGDVRRAALLERLGDGYAGAANETQSRRMYTQALGTWDRVLEGLQGEGAAPFIAETQVHRGILLGHLARRDESQAAFRQAIAANSQDRGIYAAILSFLVVAEPDREFAETIFRAARNQTNLAPEWRVYFALWVRIIAIRAGEEPSSDVVAALRQTAQLEGWSGQLARFGAETLSGDELLESAESKGQQTEGLFYAGAFRLGAEPVAGKSMMERALEFSMIGFYEHTMAQQLVRQSGE
ncbi:MAG: tetratricopeptide (TPR) repeat protein, partial [Polyangiales bacterium]